NKKKDVFVTNQEFAADHFPLSKGWALKANQKFGHRGSGKRMSLQVIQLLEGFFLAGTLNKSDHYDAGSMHADLVVMVEEGNLDRDEIPKTETINNWISRYSTAFRKESARTALQSNSGSNKV
ncbi:12078_t:CDS:2, partial [Entrophospora sp. SA101]